jgi:hypothetical protein
VIPPFAKFGLLPPGIHWTTWEEFRQHFNFTPRREALLVGLKAALDSLTLAGCTALYIVGGTDIPRILPGGDTAGNSHPQRHHWHQTRRNTT